MGKTTVRAVHQIWSDLQYIPPASSQVSHVTLTGRHVEGKGSRRDLSITHGVETIARRLGQLPALRLLFETA